MARDATRKSSAVIVVVLIGAICWAAISIGLAKVRRGGFAAPTCTPIIGLSPLDPSVTAGSGQDFVAQLGDGAVSATASINIGYDHPEYLNPPGSPATAPVLH